MLSKFMFDRIKYYIMFLKGPGLQLHAYKCMLTTYIVSSYRKKQSITEFVL